MEVRMGKPKVFHKNNKIEDFIIFGAQAPINTNSVYWEKMEALPKV